MRASRLIKLAACLLIFNYLSAQVNIEGIIRDDQTGEPLMFASVFIEDMSKGAVADEWGNFSISNLDLEPGEYQLTAAFMGYKDFNLPIAIVSGKEQFSLELSLKARSVKLAGPIIDYRVDKSAPFSFSNVYEKDLEQTNVGQDMPFLLKWTPSAVETSDSGTGIGYTGLRIRGSDGTRTNVTINGVALNDSESQGTFWVNLPDFASSVESVQIQRGVGVSTNGAGAFGAGVHLNTLSRNERPFGTISGAIGSFGTLKSSINFGSGLINKRFTVEGRLSRIESDGYIDRAEAELESYYLSANYWGKKSRLNAILIHGHEVTYQAWFGVPAQFVDDEEQRTFNPAGAKADGSFHDNQVDDYTQTHHQLHYQQELGGNWMLNLSGHYTRGQGFFEEYIDRELNAFESSFSFYGLPDLEIGGDTITNTSLIRRRWLDNHFFGAVYYLETKGNNWNFSFGGAANHYIGNHFGEIIWAEYAVSAEQGYRYYDADADKTDITTYVKGDISFNRQWSVYTDLQYRNVRYDLETLDRSRKISNDYHFFNPKVGITYRPDNQTRIYSSFAVANREPGRFDFLDADPDRLPEHETLLDVELGYERAWSDKRININGFYMKYIDQLALTGQINQDALPVRVNIPDSYRLGVEWIGQWEMTDRLTLDGALTLSENIIPSFTEYIDNWDTGGQEVVEHSNTNLAFSPSVLFNGGLTYTLINSSKQKLECSLLGKYVSRQYIDNTSRESASIDPYFYSDFRVNYELKLKSIQSIKLLLLVRNVFDARYSSNAWTYRYIAGFDNRSVDPYTQLEGGNRYNLTGFFPQAGRNVLVGLSVDF